MRKTRRALGTLLLALLAASPAFAAVETYAVDKAHTSVTFKIRHVVSKVDGQFKDFDGKIWIDRENPAASKVEFTIQAASLDTRNENRDKHLRSADFFDVEKYPTITFKSTRVVPKGQEVYDVTGDLTIRGVTKSFTIPVRHGGFASVGKAEKTGFDLNLTLDRKDFGVNWNRALDQGGVLLGDEVEISIGVEANKEVPAAPEKAPVKS